MGQQPGTHAADLDIAGRAQPALVLWQVCCHQRRVQAALVVGPVAGPIAQDDVIVIVALGVITPVAMARIPYVSCWHCTAVEAAWYGQLHSTRAPASSPSYYPQSQSNLYSCCSIAQRTWQHTHCSHAASSSHAASTSSGQHQHWPAAALQPAHLAQKMTSLSSSPSSSYWAVGMQRWASVSSQKRSASRMMSRERCTCFSARCSSSFRRTRSRLQHSR